jgi:hypothetical protein
VKSWLKKLIDQLTERQNGLVLLGLSFIHQSKPELQTSGSNATPACPLCGVIPINWTVHNKWCRFVVETKSSHTLLVGTDGHAVRVPVDRATHSQQGCAARRQPAVEKTCGENVPKRKKLSADSHLPGELSPEEQRKGRNVSTRAAKGSGERETGSAEEDTHPVRGVSEIHCHNCHATSAQLADHGDPGPCCNRFLTCSYDLLWRSLPGGEDR